MATTPSIAMIPSGYKDEKVYSVLPTNGDGDFTFARTSTATRVNSNGLIEEVAVNAPRLDYSDGACPSLLLEPLSRNLIQYSEEFSNAYWTKSGSSVAGGFVSPSADSPTNAFKLVEDNSNGLHRMASTAIAVTIGVDYSLNVYAKYDGRPLQIFTGAAAGNLFANFDLENGVVGSKSASVTSKIEGLPNGWYRCAINFSAASTGNMDFSIITVETLTSSIATGYQGNGTSGVYIFGVQLEQQSYATSYIKNEGTAAGITRAADTATGSGDATVINSTEGVLYAEISSFGNDGTTSKITLNDSSSNNHVAISYSNVTNTIRCILYNGSVFGEITTNAYDILSNHKIAYLYKSGDFKLYIDGSLVDTSNDAFTISGLNNLSFDNGSSTSKFNGKAKDVRVYTTALSDAELTTLTTI